MVTLLSPKDGVRLSQRAPVPGDGLPVAFGQCLHRGASTDTVAVPDSTRHDIDSCNYDAFGILLNFDARMAKTDWASCDDRPWDPNSLFTYHLARFRDGERFISYDTFEADPTTPASLHKYAYGHASPIEHTDPSGHFIKSVGVGGGLYVDSLITAGLTMLLMAYYIATIPLRAGHASAIDVRTQTQLAPVAQSLGVEGRASAPSLLD